MNGMYCFARRIVSVVALAILVLAGSPQRTMLNLPGSIRKPKNCCGA